MEDADAVGIRSQTFSSKDEAEAYLSRIAESISAVDFKSGDFHINYAGGSIGRCALHRASHSAMSFKVSSSDDVHIAIPQRNGIKFKGRDVELEAAAQRSALLLVPSCRGKCDIPDGITGISLLTSRTSMQGYAEKLVGRPLEPASMLGPARSLPLADPLISAMARNVTTVFHEMQKLGQSGLSALASANFDELLLGLAVMAVVPDVRGTLGPTVNNVGTAVVRRARDYIHAHATEPIRFSELADHLGVSLRSLQLGFQREIGCSPRDYLMTCRLELARVRLMAGCPSTRVTALAYECGFTDLTTFSRKYREAFGELPSETLRGR